MNELKLLLPFHHQCCIMRNAQLGAICESLEMATLAAFAEAECILPQDVKWALNQALEQESSPTARRELENILENVALAERRMIPMCQDTGVPVCFLTLPPEIPFATEILEAIARGVRRATRTIPLRPNVVDPCTRVNRGDNTGVRMPLVHIMPGETLSITAFPKGAGSENLSRIAMLLPSEVERIKEFVVETVLLAGAKACPPLVLGVGIGSTFEGAAMLAKEALLEPLNEMTPYERDILDAVNRLGIGPMGLGGDTTALAVRVKRADCHTASLPVAVNVQCWACRRVRKIVEVPS